jgi:hypothetical protein
MRGRLRTGVHVGRMNGSLSMSVDPLLGTFLLFEFDVVRAIVPLLLLPPCALAVADAVVVNDDDDPLVA